MSRYEKIKAAIEEMDTTEVIDLHNSYCDENNDPDGAIYSMEDFDELMSGQTPWEIARAAYFGERFNPCDNWFRFNGYGNLESFDFAPGCNSGVYPDDIADYIDRNGDALDNDAIRDILDEDEDEDEDEDD